MNRREGFINALQLLLEQFDCHIEADDHYMGYPECGQDIRMTVEFGGSQTEDIDLGTSIYKDTDWKSIFKEIK